jgi:hypothetical protein
LLAAEHPLGRSSRHCNRRNSWRVSASGWPVADLHALGVELGGPPAPLPALREGAMREDGLDPRRHFTRAERLDHVVVGADFQAHHAVDLGIPR